MQLARLDKTPPEMQLTWIVDKTSPAHKTLPCKIFELIIY